MSTIFKSVVTLSFYPSNSFHVSSPLPLKFVSSSLIPIVTHSYAYTVQVVYIYTFYVCMYVYVMCVYCCSYYVPLGLISQDLICCRGACPWRNLLPVSASVGSLLLFIKQYDLAKFFPSTLLCHLVLLLCRSGKEKNLVDMSQVQLSFMFRGHNLATCVLVLCHLSFHPCFRGCRIACQMYKLVSGTPAVICFLHFGQFLALVIFSICCKTNFFNVG